MSFESLLLFGKGNQKTYKFKFINRKTKIQGYY